jgi:hypothetical protein
MDTQLKIVNKQQQFKEVTLIEPSKSCYLLISAEIDHSPFPFFLATSPQKQKLIREAKEWCKKLERESNVISAVVFKASVIPPGKGKFLKKRLKEVQLARYDFAILIEAPSLSNIESIKSSGEYKNMESAIKSIATLAHIITASNIKRINPVNHKKQGVFLFNYFYADNLQQNIDVWHHTAGWFQQETGLDNSTVLLPIDKDKSKYTIINHCRWDKMSDVLPSLIFKCSFHSFVLDNFYANNVGAMPVLYKLA